SRVGDPARLVEQLASEQHRHRGGDVALAAGDDARVVELGEGDAPRGVQIGDEVEASHRDRVEPVSVDDPGEGRVHGGRRDGLEVGLPLAGELDRDIVHLDVGGVAMVADRLVDVDVDQLDAPLRLERVAV